MTPAEDIISLKQTDWTVTELEEFIKEHPYRGYPIVKSHDNDVLCGYILRNDLLAALSKQLYFPICSSGSSPSF